MDEQARGIQQTWEALWAHGVADSLDALDQISFLLALRYLELVEYEQPSLLHGREACRWSYLMDLTPKAAWHAIRDEVPDQLDELLGDASSARWSPRGLDEAGPERLRAAMEPLDGLTLPDIAPFYEQLLAQLANEARALHTPRDVAEAMLRLAEVQPGDLIVDPCAGMAQLLVEAHRASPDARLRGWEQDERMARIGTVNLLVHGGPRSVIELHDWLTAGFEAASVDVAMSAPRFGPRAGFGDAVVLDLASNRSEAMIVELCRRMLRPGGRGVVVVPEGLLFSGTKGFVEVRRRLVELSGLRAVISLPSGVFRPYSSVKTAILMFDAAPAATDTVLFCDVRSPGATTSGVASGGGLMLIPPVLARLRADPSRWSSDRLPDPLREQAWTASSARIAANGYELTPQSYRPVDERAPEREDPAALLAELVRLEERFGERLSALEGFLDAAP